MTSSGAISLSDRARDDLLDLWLYVAESNLAAADRIVDEIERVIGLLSENPHMGRERIEVMPGIRSLAAPPWVIFYRVEREGILVARIVHGARDLDQLDY